MGYLLYRYFPDARGSGVPQTKAAMYARDGNITLSTVFGKFFCTSATLASGIPLGREGPAVQVGGGIASVLGRTLGLPTERVKALIPVGAAAAVAAAFNTPLAAVLFALEEVVGELRAGAAKVVALGGGAFVQQENAALLRTARVPTVFLDAPVEELWHRCSEQARQAGAERPLLRSIDHFRELYEMRRTSYLEAALRVETGSRTVDEIASEIAERLGLTKLEIRAQEGEFE